LQIINVVVLVDFWLSEVLSFNLIFTLISGEHLFPSFCSQVGHKIFH
jgi:hypothetical protein